jgi:hypothetical protein
MCPSLGAALSEWEEEEAKEDEGEKSDGADKDDSRK